MGIPWILHQTYKSHTLTKEWNEYRDTWNLFGDTWDYRFYLDEDLDKHIQDYFPHYLEKFRSFSHFIERVDFARYAILYTFGGVYADLDMQKLKSFAPIMKLNSAILASEVPEHTVRIYKKHLVLSNAIMITNPQNPYWLSLMDFIMNHYDPKQKAIYNTGPMALTLHWEEAFRNGGMKIPNIHEPVPITNHLTLFPSCTLLPETWTNQISSVCDVNDAYAVHKWTTSWVATGGLVKAAKWMQKNMTWLIPVVLIAVLLVIAIPIIVVYFHRKKKRMLAEK